MRRNRMDSSSLSVSRSNSLGPSSKSVDDTSCCGVFSWFNNKPILEVSETLTVSETTVLMDDIENPHTSNKKNDDLEKSSMSIQDKLSMFVLLVLYTLQGIPMGLSGSIPLLLKERNVSFEGIALFSLVSMPFSLKLLWAPLVDSVYLKSMGRRKTWLVPVQILCGIFMIVGGRYISF